MENLIELSKYKLKPRHKWFSQTSPDADEGWYGPHNTIEDAFIDCQSSSDGSDVVYIGQGHKMTKQECEDWGVDFSWEVDTRNLIQVRELGEI